MRPLILAVLLLGCNRDHDYDGFGAKDDCDDADPFVYPGAPDTPGDGLDADCADGDPALPWLGDWSLTTLMASYSGIELFVEGTASGTLNLEEDGSAALEATATLNPDVIGQELAITVILAGETSVLNGEEGFLVYAEGDNFGERMHVDWDCAEDADGLLCLGELKALDASLDATAGFVRP